MGLEIDKLEGKVNSLEIKIKWMRISLIVIVLMFFAQAYRDYSRKVFSGRWIAIKDGEEKLRGWLDEEGLELKDKTGIVRAKLGLSQDGSPFLQFYDQKHQLRAHLFVYADGSGYLMLWDKDGKGIRVPASKVPLP